MASGGSDAGPSNSRAKTTTTIGGEMAAGYIQRFPSKRCFERNFKSYVQDTMTKFVVWTKDRTFGVEGKFVLLLAS